MARWRELWQVTPTIASGPTRSAGLVVVRIFLADMNAVRAELGGKVGAIIDQKRHVVGLGNRHQRLGLPARISSSGAPLSRSCRQATSPASKARLQAKWSAKAAGSVIAGGVIR